MYDKESRITQLKSEIIPSPEYDKYLPVEMAKKQEALMNFLSQRDSGTLSPKLLRILPDVERMVLVFNVQKHNLISGTEDAFTIRAKSIDDLNSAAKRLGNTDLYDLPLELGGIQDSKLSPDEIFNIIHKVKENILFKTRKS